MRKMVIFLAGLGLGYVLGARAGRERYDQIRDAARRVAEHPTVQEATGVIQAQATGLMSAARDVVSDKISHTSLGAKMHENTENYRNNQASRPTATKGSMGTAAGQSGASTSSRS